MSNWWVVNNDPESPNHKQMIYGCDDDGRSHCSIGSDQCWLEVPEGVALGNAKVLEDEDGNLYLADGAADRSNSNPEWAALRSARDARLSACDWTQLADSPLSSENKSAWATYRQALRDLPEGTEDPNSPEWPEAPGA